MTMHLQQLKGMQSSKQGMWKGHHLSTEGIWKGYLFLENIKICWVIPQVDAVEGPGVGGIWAFTLFIGQSEAHTATKNYFLVWATFFSLGPEESAP